MNGWILAVECERKIVRMTDIYRIDKMGVVDGMVIQKMYIHRKL